MSIYTTNKQTNTMNSIAISVNQTKYNNRVVTFEYTKNESIDDFLLFCRFIQNKYEEFAKKIDFLADNLPIIDEINLLKSYCYTFDDAEVNMFAKEEIKGRYREMLGLKQVMIVIDYNLILQRYDIADVQQEIRDFFETTKTECV